MIGKDIIKDSRYEQVGRLAKNAFGIDESLILEQRYWNHFDWLVEQGYEMSLWTQEADICRLRNYGFTKWQTAVNRLLKNDEKKRFHLNLDCPLHICSGGYEQSNRLSVDQIYLVERLPTDNEPVARTYKSALGVDVSIEMHGKYWRHLDWLCEMGGEQLAQEWVTFADFDRSAPDMSLSEKLQALLRGHEEKEYLSYLGDRDVECPLFISPIGYFSKYMQELSTRAYFDSDNKLTSVRMFDHQWDYLDRLGEQGIDLKAFIKLAHAIHKKRRKYDCFSDALIAATIQDFKKRATPIPRKFQINSH